MCNVRDPRQCSAGVDKPAGHVDGGSSSRALTQWLACASTLHRLFPGCKGCAVRVCSASKSHHLHSAGWLQTTKHLHRASPHVVSGALCSCGKCTAFSPHATVSPANARRMDPLAPLNRFGEAAADRFLARGLHGHFGHHRSQSGSRQQPSMSTPGNSPAQPPYGYEAGRGRDNGGSPPHPYSEAPLPVSQLQASLRANMQLQHLTSLHHHLRTRAPKCPRHRRLPSSISLHRNNHSAPRMPPTLAPAENSPA